MPHETGRLHETERLTVWRAPEACLYAVIMVVLAVSSAAHAQHVETYAYDSHGRLIEVQRSSNRSTQYALGQATNRDARQTFEQYDALWQSESLAHGAGYAVPGGWAANTSTPSTFVVYGPYTTGVPVGMNTASWRMSVDNNSSPDASYVATIDVWDATANEQLAARTLTRHAWMTAATLQDFELPFVLKSTSAGHMIEFRTWFHGAAAITADQVGYRHGGGAWLAATELPHQIGYLDGDGWSADTSGPAGFMTYGPYGGVIQGARTATWRMKVDDIASPDTSPVVQLDIWDATTSEQLATITLNRNNWSAANTYQTFDLPFVQDASRNGHAMEFRTYYAGAAKVTVQWIGIR